MGANPGAASHSPAPSSPCCCSADCPCSSVSVCKRVQACNRCREQGSWREDFYTFCTFVTREICLCYFSAFLSPGVLRLGWEGEGDRGERGAEFGPIWVPGKLLALSSHLNGEDSDRRGKCTPTPYSLVDLHTVGAPSAELIFAFAWMLQGTLWGLGGLVLKTGVL